MRAKYTHRTKLRFMLCVFRPCRGPSPSKIRIKTLLLFSGADGFSVSVLFSVRCCCRETYPEKPYAACLLLYKPSRFRFDDSAKGSAASSARKRAYARNRSPKVALAGKSIVTVRNTNLKISITCGRFRSSEAVKTEPSKERKRAGRKISPRPLKTGLKTSTERKTICQDIHLFAT